LALWRCYVNCLFFFQSKIIEKKTKKKEARVTFRIPTPAIANLFALLAFYQPLLGQPASSTAQLQTFNVHGTIADQTGGVIQGTKISFQSGLFTKEVVTDKKGTYGVDLPLGVYTMTAQYRGFNVFHRPPFRVSKPARITFDATLIVTASCDVVSVDPTGEACPSEESFGLPSEDHVPFELYVRYGSRGLSGSIYSFADRKSPYGNRVFVAYNLFSLQADRVTYNASSRVLDAQGNVSYVSESGQTQRADSLAFKIEGGQAVRLR
jgi:hypothetical protein